MLRTEVRGIPGLLWRAPNGAVHLLSRNLKDLSPSFPELVCAGDALATGSIMRHRVWPAAKSKVKIRLSVLRSSPSDGHSSDTPSGPPTSRGVPPQEQRRVSLSLFDALERNRSQPLTRQLSLS
jgi:hypothetical protein